MISCFLFVFQKVHESLSPIFCLSGIFGQNALYYKIGIVTFLQLTASSRISINLALTFRSKIGIYSWQNLSPSFGQMACANTGLCLNTRLSHHRRGFDSRLTPAHPERATEAESNSAQMVAWTLISLNLRSAKTTLGLFGFFGTGLSYIDCGFLRPVLTN